MVFCTECGHSLVSEEKALPEAKSKDVPRQIRNILARNELVEKDFRVKGHRLYATSRRLLELKGHTIRDFDYAHISSVAYTSKRYFWLIGVVFIIIGALVKEEFVETNVVGVPDPIKYEGSRQTLHSLLQLIKEKQAAEPAAGPKETKDIASIEAIRKLAELRDQGILTQEEFEVKKRKLL